MFSLDTHNQSINQQISLKQTYTVETFESSRNPNVLSAPRFRSQSPSGLVSDFPIVALLALTVSIDRQVIRRVSSEIFPHQVTPEPSFAWSRSQDAHRSLSSSVRWHAPHTPFYFCSLSTLAEDVGQNIGTPSGTGSLLF